MTVSDDRQVLVDDSIDLIVISKKIFPVIPLNLKYKYTVDPGFQPQT